MAIEYVRQSRMWLSFLAPEYGWKKRRMTDSNLTSEGICLVGKFVEMDRLSEINRRIDRLVAAMEPRGKFLRRSFN